MGGDSALKSCALLGKWKTVSRKWSKVAGNADYRLGLQEGPRTGWEPFLQVQDQQEPILSLGDKIGQEESPVAPQLSFRWRLQGQEDPGRL